MMVLFSQEYLAVFYPRPLTWELVKLLLIDTISHPLFWIPCGLLMALWGFAMVDAARGAGRSKPAREPIAISSQLSAKNQGFAEAIPHTGWAPSAMHGLKTQGR